MVAKKNNKPRKGAGRKAHKRPGKKAPVRRAMPVHYAPSPGMRALPALRRAILNPCGHLNGLEFLPGPAGRVIFRTNASKVLGLATTSANISGGAWGAGVPGAVKVNHDTVCATLDPWRMSLGVTSQPTSTYSVFVAGGTDLADTTTGAALPLPVVGGYFNVLGACLRLKYIGTESNRSGFGAGATGFASQIGAGVLTLPGGTAVPFTDGTAGVPVATQTASTLTSDGMAVNDNNGVEVILDVTMGSEAAHEAVRQNTTATVYGVTCGSLSNVNVDHPVCVAYLTGLQTASKVLATAHVIYEWVPDISQAYEFASAGDTPSTSVLWDNVKKAMHHSKRIDWVRGINAAIRLMSTSGGSVQLIRGSDEL